MTLPHPKIESPNPPTATDVRFSTRSLLIIMAVVAVAAAALGAFIRTFPEDVRLSLAAYWGFLIAITIGLIIYHARKRYVAEQQAGQVLFVLPTHSYFLPRIPWVSAALATTLLIAGPALWIAGSLMIKKGNLIIPWLSWNTYIGPVAAAAGITMFWWRQVRVAEHGMIVCSKFVPWEDVLGWHWESGDGNVIVIAYKQVGAVTAQIPKGSRESVRSLLNAKVASRKQRLS